MDYSGVIVASGKGGRFATTYNKIFYVRGGQTILERATNPFISDPDCKQIIIVCNSKELLRIQQIINNPKVEFTVGGDVRAQSVLNGLQLVKYPYVLIHDAARPNIDLDLINRVKSGLIEFNIAIPTVLLVEASIVKDKYVSEVNIVQTPQGFNTKLLLECYNDQSYLQYRDEGSLFIEKTNIPINLVKGSLENVKITYPKDKKLIRS
jgi:2-C-methyl-D-erythritol 4-phosphate cytidylyltransferase